MPDPLEELRRNLQSLRHELTRAEPRKSQPSVAPAAAAPPVAAPDPEPPSRQAFGDESWSRGGWPGEHEDDQSGWIEERPSRREISSASRPGAWLRYNPPLCLAAIFAGAVLDMKSAMLAGLAGLLGQAVAAAFSGPGAAASEDVSELRRRLEAIERRVESLGTSSSTGTASPELEEEIRELRRILKSMMRTLEEPAPSPGEGES